MQAYHDEQEARKAEEGVWLEGLREEREALKRIEARKGHVRVNYRRKQLQNKLSRQKEVLVQKAKEERDREERLAALRQQVRKLGFYLLGDDLNSLIQRLY